MSQQFVKDLLPPVKLYRRLLRVHRNLPKDYRLLGDGYLRDEFRRHRNIDNPLHIIGFLSSWKLYLDQLENPSNNNNINDLDLNDLLNKLSNEQVSQLYELLNEIKKV